MQTIRVLATGTAAGSLAGEPGVSYLVRAGGARVLFDSGLSGGKRESVLARNARTLGAGLQDLDAVVISHLHADHVGGIRARPVPDAADRRGNHDQRGGSRLNRPVPRGGPQQSARPGTGSCAGATLGGVVP